jgi:peptidoglycan hydrolase-like protein with peptidoglycan-binding domain
MVDVLGSIKQGEKSDRVRILQKLLNKHGYKLDIDGSCGPLTNDAIEDFQGKMKIQVDGHVGKITASYL